MVGFESADATSPGRPAERREVTSVLAPPAVPDELEPRAGIPNAVSGRIGSLQRTCPRRRSARSRRSIERVEMVQDVASDHHRGRPPQGRLVGDNLLLIRANICCCRVSTPRVWRRRSNFLNCNSAGPNSNTGRPRIVTLPIEGSGPKRSTARPVRDSRINRAGALMLSRRPGGDWATSVQAPQPVLRQSAIGPRCGLNNTSATAFERRSCMSRQATRTTPSASLIFQKYSLASARASDRPSRRSTIVAIPWPTPMHIVARP